MRSIISVVTCVTRNRREARARTRDEAHGPRWGYRAVGGAVALMLELLSCVDRLLPGLFFHGAVSIEFLCGNLGFNADPEQLPDHSFDVQGIDLHTRELYHRYRR